MQLPNEPAPRRTTLEFPYRGRYLHLYRLQPPYELPEECCEPGDFLQPETDRGSIAAVRPSPGARLDETKTFLQCLSRALVSMPVVLWLDLLPRHDAINFAVPLRNFGARACVARSIPSLEALRTQLSDPDLLSADLVRWLLCRREELPPETLQLLGKMARDAILYRTMSDWLSSSGCIVRSRRQFAAQGLGALNGWFQSIRLIGLALVLQHNPAKTVEAIAFESGYYDAAALRRR